MCFQVTAITTGAESCEQHISYSCQMSRLLNTPGKNIALFPTDSSQEARGPGAFLCGDCICVGSLGLVQLPATCIWGIE